MKFFDDAWFLAKRLWSVRMAALGVAWASASSAWLLLPPEWRPELSEFVRWVVALVGIALASAPGIAALVRQPKLDDKIQQRKGVAP